MFISKRKLQAQLNKAYLEGYAKGKKEGYQNAIFEELTPNTIRKAFGMLPLEVITYNEPLKEELK